MTIYCNGYANLVSCSECQLCPDGSICSDCSTTPTRQPTLTPLKSPSALAQLPTNQPVNPPVSQPQFSPVQAPISFYPISSASFTYCPGFGSTIQCNGCQFCPDGLLCPNCPSLPTPSSRPIYVGVTLAPTQFSYCLGYGNMVQCRGCDQYCPDGSVCPGCNNPTYSSPTFSPIIRTPLPTIITPTISPTLFPTLKFSIQPTFFSPTIAPSPFSPTLMPSPFSPTIAPFPALPTLAPITVPPTFPRTSLPTSNITAMPTIRPTSSPTNRTSVRPTISQIPSLFPTLAPIRNITDECATSPIYCTSTNFGSASLNAAQYSIGITIGFPFILLVILLIHQAISTNNHDHYRAKKEGGAENRIETHHKSTRINLSVHVDKESKHGDGRISSSLSSSNRGSKS